MIVHVKWLPPAQKFLDDLYRAHDRVTAEERIDFLKTTFGELPHAKDLDDMRIDYLLYHYEYFALANEGLIDMEPPPERYSFR